MNSSGAAPQYRLELLLSKPPLGWFPKPTVVLNGRGHPAQWGSGTWQVEAGDSAVIKVFLFNRMWRFGEAEVDLGSLRPARLVYTAPWLPFLAGRLRVHSER